MKKRVVCVLMVVFMFFSIPANSLAIDFAKEYTADEALDLLERNYRGIYGDSEEYNTAKRFIGIYRTDPMFSLHYQSDPEDAIAMVASVVDHMIEPDPVVELGEAETHAAVYSVSGVPSYQQVQSNSCGAASALQVIVQQGGASNIHGSTYTQKEKTLISETGLGTGSQTSVMVYEVRNLINDYIPSGSKYYYIACDDLTESEFTEYIRDSFIDDCPVILHAIKGYLDYYPSSDMGGHYIVGTALRPPEKTLTLNDCNWRDEYAGVHTVSITSAYESAHEYKTTRYLIYGQSN